MPLDIIEQVNRHYENQAAHRGQKWRRYTNSASSLGDSCTRKLVYARVRAEDQKAPDTRLMRIFELGDMFEDYAIRVLSEAGVRVVHTQISSRWEKFNISGHVDFEAVDGDELIPTDIKSLNPFTYARLNTASDLESEGWTAKYLAQIVLYIWMLERERGWLLLINKSSNEWKIIEVRRDDWIELAEVLLQKAEAIERHVTQYQNTEGNPEDTLPERINIRSECERCPFEHICCPTLEYGPGTEIIDNAAVVDQLIEREELDEGRLRFKKIDAEVKSMFALPPELDEYEWFVTDQGQADREFIVKQKRGRNGAVRTTITRPEL